MFFMIGLKPNATDLLQPLCPGLPCIFMILSTIFLYFLNRISVSCLKVQSSHLTNHMIHKLCYWWNVLKILDCNKVWLLSMMESPKFMLFWIKKEFHLIARSVFVNKTILRLWKDLWWIDCLHTPLKLLCFSILCTSLYSPPPSHLAIVFIQMLEVATHDNLPRDKWSGLTDKGQE